MKITECPKCGETELGRGKQTGMGTIIPNGKVSFGEEVEHLICSQCGLIIESYVKKPEKFKGTYY
nr:transcription initiation factor TFIIIB [Lentibacillus sp. JNUCC-1]